MDDINKNIESTSEVLEIISNSSLHDFIKNEEYCEDVDSSVDSIFAEISKLASLGDDKYNTNDDSRTIEDILKEAEALINQPLGVESRAMFPTISCESTPLEIKNNILDQYDYSTTTLHDDDHDTTSDRTLLNDQLDTLDSCPSSPDTVSSMKSKKSSKSSGSKKSLKCKKNMKHDDEIEDPPQKVDDFVNEKVCDEIVQFEFDEFITEKVLCDKSTAPSPTHSIVSSSSFSSNWARERELETTNEDLHEKLKDTEERLQSLRIQYDSISQAHRVLRESHLQLQEETEKLKIDHQILTECGNVLRCELQASRKDHEAAVEIQKILQQELDENRVDKKKFQEITERDSKTILDLQRQCKEMERILMRKHPDSVSALIVASKNSPAQDASASTRKLLEDRIAQLEADAKEQDKKAQGILASVQARFKTVQAKYETHIQDLETQVLSLQQINMEVNRELAAKCSSGVDGSTQTIDVPEREKVPCRTIGVQTTANSTSNPPSRTNSSQSIASSKKSNKIPNSQSDSSIQSKDDAHLLATLRGMRVELAIKEKAVQRLTRDLDECKKTIKKLQAERDKYLTTKEKSATPKKVYNPANYTENSDTHALKEAMEKINVLQGDFKSLYEKRLKDLKTLQLSHERELSACHETIRILQNRLEEESSKNSKDKRRGPIDYYALKAKVTNLERRHSEREKSLHLLIDALSKGKLSGLQLNASGSPCEDDSLSPHSCNSPVNKNL